MNNYLKWITHQGKRILFIDFSNIDGEKHITGILKSDDFNDKLEKGGIIGTYQMMMAVDGKTWFEAYGVKLKYDGESINIIFLFNITKHKETERKLKEKSDGLDTLMQQKDDFIWQLGHDLKTPLVPILAFLPVFEEKEQDPELKEILPSIIENFNIIKKRISEILDVAELRAFGTDFIVKNESLHEIVDISIQNHKDEIFKNNIKVNNEIDEELIVRVDKEKLIEVFNNLFSNSLKYSLKDSTVTVYAMEDSDCVHVSFEDSGIGIAKEQTKHIFDEFYKVDKSRHDITSSGLGLSVCKQIIEKHGGKIWVESIGPQKGTTFYFTFKNRKTNNDKSI